MTKNVILKFIFVIILFPWVLIGHDGTLKLKSKVELRNWKLTSKALKSQTFLKGASVKLYKANTIVSGIMTDEEGNFEISIPSDGEYTLLIEYPGRESKKFAVNAKTVSLNKNDANSKPSVDIIGILMSKPKKGMEYIGLDQPTITKTDQSSRLRTNIYDGEYKLIQKFCTANKLGDMALEKKNYQLAKIFYSMATDMIDSEDYPKAQIKKAQEGMKLEMASRKKQKSKQSKTKSAITNQKTASKSTKNSGGKNSVETGKPTRKTRKVLGK
jgi:hypothetical protein